MNKRADYTVNGLRCYWVGDALLYHQGDEDCDAIYNEIHEVDETLADSFQIYPNPTDNLLYVIPNTVKPSSPYHITNLLGRTLMSGTLSDSAIDVSSLPKGLYFLTVDGQTVKLMKQ